MSRKRTGHGSRSGRGQPASILKKMSIVMLAGVTLLPAAPVHAHEDDDEEDWKERQEHYQKKRKKEVHRHYYYYYRPGDLIPPPAVIYRDPPSLPAVPLSPSASPRLDRHAAPPAGFPRESEADRTAAKERQREILQKELAAEQELLARAKKDLAEENSRQPSDERAGSEAFQRLRSAKENVELHERNVAALRQELNNLNR